MLLSDDSQTVRKKKKRKKGEILTFLGPLVLWWSRCLIEVSQAGEEVLLQVIPLLLHFIITFWSRMKQSGTPAKGPRSELALNNLTQPVSFVPHLMDSIRWELTPD